MTDDLDKPENTTEEPKEGPITEESQEPPDDEEAPLVANDPVEDVEEKP